MPRRVTSMHASVFPAHAGMIPSSRKAPRSVDCVPRACGDDPVLGKTHATLTLCSPRMRG